MFENASNTLAQGAIGLSRAIYEYQRMGYTVSIPLIDAQYYDLIIEKNGKLQSVQCKTSKQKVRNREKGGYYEGIYRCSLVTTKTNTKRSITGPKGNFDILFVMCENDNCYSIPSRAIPNREIEVGGKKYKEYRIT